MTAPNVAAPPANETASDSLESALGTAFRDTMVEGGTPETDLARDPTTGRFVPRETSEDGTPEPAVVIGDKVLPDGTPPTTETQPVKDGESVVLEAADPAELVTTFTLKDANGELAIPKGLIIDYKANGKDVSDPLDKVVKFAQIGRYNHEREQRFQQVEQRADETEQRYAQVQEYAANRDKQLEALLADDVYRQKALDAYAAQQTPEAQAQRLQDEREQLAIDRERAEIDRVGAPYYEQQVVPSLDLIEKACPNVSHEEIVGKLKSFTDRLIDPRTGRIPVRHHETINRFFATADGQPSDFVRWAQQLDEYRAVERGTKSGKQLIAEQKKTATTTDKEKEALQLRAQRSRNQASANLRPPGRVAPTGTPQKSTLTNKSTHEDRLNDVISSTLSAVNGSS